MIFKLDETNKLQPPLYAPVEKGKFTRLISHALLYYLASYKHTGQVGIRRDNGVLYVFLHINDQDIYCIGWTCDFNCYFDLYNKNQSEKHTREEQSELIMATKLAYYHRRGVNVNRYFMGNYSTTRRNCNDYFSYSGGISNAPGSEYSVRSLSGEFTQ